MVNLEAKLQLAHIRQRSQGDGEIRLEVTTVVRASEELAQLETESRQISLIGLRADSEDDALLQVLAASGVLDPETVADGVRDLDELLVVDAAEEGVHERDVLDDQGRAGDFDAVTTVEGVLDEEEDARAQEFSDGTTDSEGQTSEGRPESGEVRRKAGGEESSEDDGRDDEDEGRQKAIQDLDSLVDVVHALGTEDTGTDKVSHELGHLFSVDIAVAILIQDLKDLLGRVSLHVQTRIDNDLLDIFESERVLRVQVKRLPDGRDETSGTLLSREQRLDHLMGESGAVATLTRDVVGPAHETSGDQVVLASILRKGSLAAIAAGVTGERRNELVALASGVNQEIEDTDDLLLLAGLASPLAAMVLHSEDLDRQFLKQEDTRHNDDGEKSAVEVVDPFQAADLSVHVQNGLHGSPRDN